MRPLCCQSTSPLYSQLYSSCGSGFANMTYSPSCFTVFIFWQFAQVIYRNLQSRTEVLSDGQDGCIAHSIHQCSCTVTRSCQQPACVGERQCHHTRSMAQDITQTKMVHSNASPSCSSVSHGQSLLVRCAKQQ